MINKLYDYLSSLPQDDCYLVNRSYGMTLIKVRKLCEDLNFFFEGLHNFRHTFTSLMLKARENPLLVKEFLGHSDLSMINKVYAHYIQDNEDCVKFGAVLEQYRMEA